MTDKEVLQKQYSEVIGKRILLVRPMSDEEQTWYGWEESWGTIPCVFQLEGGVALVPMSDPEGNHAGFVSVERLQNA